MSEGARGRRPGQGFGAGGGEPEGGGGSGFSREQLWRHRLLQWRREFKALTGVDPKDHSAVSVWQIEHGLMPSGTVRRQEVEVARRAKTEAPQSGAQPARSSPQAAPLAPAPPATAIAEGNQFAGAHGDALVDEIAGGAERQEKVDNYELQTHLKGAGETVVQLGEASHLVFDTEEAPWLRLAMAPAILNLVRNGRYAEAAHTLALQIPVEQVVKAVVYAAKHVGLHVVADWIEGAVGLVPAAEALKECVEWTFEGLKQIGEAHEHGDRDNRIRLYGRGFAEGFLWGENGIGTARLSAATKEEMEAVAFGLGDGSKTAGRTGLLAADVGRELLRRYGGDEHRVELALLDALGRKAGLPGVWSK